MNLKFSIITPAHKNTPYHKELYDSIVAQTYKNWEWILWLNNDIKRDLPVSYTHLTLPTKRIV